MSEAVAEVKEAPEEKIEYRCQVKNGRRIWADFLEEKMCGKCHPCMMGSYEAVRILEGLEAGGGAAADLVKLDIIVDSMLTASRCKKGKDVAKAFKELLDASREEFAAHLGEAARCPAQECAALIAYEIDMERCTMCGDCLKACTFGAISGEPKRPYGSGYMPFRVRDLRCTRCDECRIACPEDAIRIMDVNQSSESTPE